MTDEAPPKYWAFISYSHRDRRWAEWLHRRMETYRVPGKLAAEGTPPRAFPVFRDRDELSSASDLTAKVVSALGASRTLVVICSPDAARSRWVNEEIRQFQKLGGADRTFAFIVAGEPVKGECFPPALTELRAEPIAADARDAGDGRKNAFLKLMAGVLNVEYDKLRRRDYERQLRTRTVWTGLLLALAAVLAGLTLYANRQRIVAIERLKVAVSRQLATEALGQMGTRLDRSLLLAIEAHRVAPTAEARGSLLRLLQSSPGLIMMLHGHERSVTALAISPDGKTIASGDASGTLRLWSIDGRPLSEKPIHAQKAMDGDEGDEVRVIAFSPDGKLVASGTLGAKVRFADVATRAPRFVESQFGATIQSLAFSPDGQQVMVCAVGLEVMNPEADTLIEPAFASLKMPDAAALSPDGTLVAASIDKALILYDYPTRRVIGTFPPQPQGADTLTFSHAGALLVETARDGTVRLWDSKLRELVGQPIRNDGYVLAVAFDGDRRMETIWSDGALRTFGIPDLAARGEAISFGPITSAAFGADLATVVTGHGNGTITIHHLGPTVHSLGTGISTGDWLNDVAFSPDGKTLAIAGDGGISLLDVQSRKETRLSGLGHVMSIAYTADGRTLAAAAEEGVTFWNLATGKPAPVPGEKQIYHVRIAVTPDGSLAAFSGRGLTLWDLRAQKVAASLAEGKEPFHALAISRSGKLLAAGAKDGSIRLFELPSGKPSGAPIPFGAHPASSLAFTPDDKALVAGVDGTKMMVFDTKTHARIGGTLPPHPGNARRIAFSPDGTLMAVSGGNRSATIVDWATRRQLGGPLFPASEHEVVSGAVFSPDGKLLALSERRQMLWLLDGGVEDWIARACRIANRNLTPDEWARYRPDEPYRSTCHVRGNVTIRHQ